MTLFMSRSSDLCLQHNKGQSLALTYIVLMFFIMLSFTNAVEPFGINPAGAQTYVDIPPNPLGQYSSLNTTVNMGFHLPYFKTLEILNERGSTQRGGTSYSVNLFIGADPDVILHSHFDYSGVAAAGQSVMPQFPRKQLAHCIGYTYNAPTEDGHIPSVVGNPNVPTERMYVGYINYGYGFGIGIYFAHEWNSQQVQIPYLESRPPIRGECRMASIKQVKMIARMNWEKYLPAGFFPSSGGSVGTYYTTPPQFPAWFIRSPTFSSESHLYSNHPLTGRTTPPLHHLDGEYTNSNGRGTLRFNLTMLVPLNLNETGFILMGLWLVEKIEIDEWTDIDGIKHTSTSPTVNRIANNIRRVEYNETALPPSRLQPAYPLFESKFSIDEFFQGTKISSVVIKLAFKEPNTLFNYDYNLNTAFRLVMVMRRHVDPRYNAPQLTWRSGTPLLMDYINSPARIPTRVFESDTDNVVTEYRVEVNPPRYEAKFQHLAEEEVTYTRFPSYWTKILMWEYETRHLANSFGGQTQPAWYSPGLLPTAARNHKHTLVGKALFSPLLSYINPKQLEDDYFGQWQNSLGALIKPSIPIDGWLELSKPSPIVTSIHPRIIAPRSVESDGIPANTEVFDVKFTYLGYIPQSANITFTFAPGIIVPESPSIKNARQSYIQVDRFQATTRSVNGPKPFVFTTMHNSTISTVKSNSTGYCIYDDPTTQGCGTVEVQLPVIQDFTRGEHIWHQPSFDVSFSFQITRKTNKGYTLPVNAYARFNDEIYYIDNDGKKMDNMDSWVSVDASVQSEDYSLVPRGHITEGYGPHPKLHYFPIVKAMTHKMRKEVIGIDFQSRIPPTIPIVARNIMSSYYDDKKHRINRNIMYIQALRTNLANSYNSFNSNLLRWIELKPSIGPITGRLDAPTPPITFKLSITPPTESQIIWNFVTDETTPYNETMTANVTVSSLILTFDQLEYFKNENLPLWLITIENKTELLPNKGFNHIPMDGSVDSGANISPFTFTTAIIFYVPSISIKVGPNDGIQTTIPIGDGIFDNDGKPLMEVKAGKPYLISIKEDDDKHSSKDIQVDLVDALTKKIIYSISKNIKDGLNNDVQDYNINIPRNITYDRAMLRFQLSNQDDIVATIQSEPFKIIPGDPCDECVASNTESCQEEEGVCHCKTHFQGTFCESRVPCVQCDIIGSESCIDTPPIGICVCKPEYGGDTCNIREKCLQCSNDGFDHCDVSTIEGICVCKPEYTGAECDLLKCSQCIDNVGFDRCDTSTINGDCICKNGYAGVNCDLFEKCIHCSGEGVDYCDENIVGGKCICEKGWIGERCNEALDPCQHCVQEHLSGCDSPNNNDNGDGNNDNGGICKCIAGWGGELCDVPAEIELCQYCNQSNLEACLPPTTKEPNGICQCKPTHTGRECNDEIYNEEENPSADEPTEETIPDGGPIPSDEENHAALVSVLIVFYIIATTIIIGVSI